MRWSIELQLIQLHCINMQREKNENAFPFKRRGAKSNLALTHKKDMKTEGSLHTQVRSLFQLIHFFLICHSSH